jgi:protein SCO1
MPATPQQTSGLRLFRIFLWSAVVVVAVFAVAWRLWFPPAGLGPTGVTGAPFTLQSTAGGSFTEASLKGTPTLVFFGYTSCPDVCPTTLAELTAIRGDLKLSPDKLRIVFATVDPKRDTLPQLTSYLSGFGTPLIGLTGSEAEVEQAKQAFGIYSKKQPADANGNYLVDHTATVFLLGKGGEFEGTLAYGESQADETAKIKRLVGA